MLIADILSRMIEGMPQTLEEEWAVELEKPVLRLYKGPTSPVLWYWFCVEPASEEDLRTGLDQSQNDEVPKPPGTRTHLRVMLKRLQKTVDREGHDWMGGRDSREHRRRWSTLTERGWER